MKYFCDLQYQNIFIDIFQVYRDGHVYNYLKLHNILSGTQTVFVALTLINRALISLTESIKNAQDNKPVGSSIYLDLQMSLYSFHFEILLANLQPDKASITNGYN